MPDAAVFTSTSPGPGSSMRTSSSERGAFCARMTAAFMSILLRRALARGRCRITGLLDPVQRRCRGVQHLLDRGLGHARERALGVVGGMLGEPAREPGVLTGRVGEVGLPEQVLGERV